MLFSSYAIGLLFGFLMGALIGFGYCWYQHAGRPVRLKDLGSGKCYKILPFRTDVYLARKTDDGQTKARFIELPEETHWQPGQEFRIKENAGHYKASLVV